MITLSQIGSQPGTTSEVENNHRLCHLTTLPPKRAMLFSEVSTISGNAALFFRFMVIAIPFAKIMGTGCTICCMQCHLRSWILKHIQRNLFFFQPEISSFVCFCQCTLSVILSENFLRNNKKCINLRQLGERGCLCFDSIWQLKVKICLKFIYYLDSANGCISMADCET